jgi:hypothetical protein
MRGRAHPEAATDLANIRLIPAGPRSRLRRRRSGGEADFEVGRRVITAEGRRTRPSTVLISERLIKKGLDL